MSDREIERQWIHNGFNCLVIFGNSLGFRFGYVGVPETNFFYGKSDEDISYFDLEDHFKLPFKMENISLDVHGGITYTGTLDALEDIPPFLWWIGYDCGHVGDLRDIDKIKDPQLRNILKSSNIFKEEEGGSIKSIDFCIAECESLADQLLDASLLIDNLILKQKNVAD